MARHSRVLMYGLPVLAAVAVTGAVLSMSKSSQSRPIVEPRQAPPVQPSVKDWGSALRGVLIGASGLVEPSGQEIRIGTDVSGSVERVLVEPGAKIGRGTPLFIIDRRVAQAVLVQRQRDLVIAQARLNHARARISGFEAEVQIAQTAIEAARAERDEADDMVQIAGQLKAGLSIPEREVTKRKSGLRASQARLDGAQARLSLAEANRALFLEGDAGAAIAIERAAVEQAKAVVALAEAELDLRIVRAPTDGTILQVNVRTGEYAQAGSSAQTGAAATALIIMGRLEPMHVRVDIDEADIARYDAGGTATASVRGAVDRSMTLRLVRLEPLVIPKRALSGQATERVDTRVMQAIYAIETTSATIRPGQQVDVFIDVTPRQLNTTMAR